MPDNDRRFSIRGIDDARYRELNDSAGGEGRGQDDTPERKYPRCSSLFYVGRDLSVRYLNRERDSSHYHSRPRRRNYDDLDYANCRGNSEKRSQKFHQAKNAFIAVESYRS